MKKDRLLIFWMVVLTLLLIGLMIWSIWFIDKEENRISVFGIVAIIIAAFTSVLTVSINNRKAREREYDLHILKEKQKVYDHFYNTLFEAFSQSKKIKTLSPKAIKEMMLFKQGLMNWGSEKLIEEFIKYDDKISEGAGTFSIINDGDIFLKEIIREMGFDDSKNLSLMSIILTSDARKELIADKGP